MAATALLAGEWAHLRAPSSGWPTEDSLPVASGGGSQADWTEWVIPPVAAGAAAGLARPPPLVPELSSEELGDPEEQGGDPTQLAHLCMGVGAAWLLSLAAAVAILLLQGFAEHSALPAVENFVVLNQMPAAWDRKYVRLSNRFGAEAFVLRRGRGRGEWLLYLSDGRIMRGILTDQRTVGHHPHQGVNYAPLPVLTPQSQEEIMNQANDLVTQRANVPQLGPFREGRSDSVRRFLNALLLLPVFSARWTRWSLRAPSRFGALLVIGYLTYDVLDRLGVYQSARLMAGRIAAAYATFRWTLSELSETATSTFEFAEAVYVAVNTFMSPVQLILYSICCGVLLWAAFELLRGSDGSSPASSTEGSPASTPPSSPRTEAPPPAPQVVQFPPEVSQCLSQQATALGELLAQQRALREELQGVALAAQSSSLLAAARPSEGGWRDSDRESLREMRARLEEFAGFVRQDRLPPEQPPPLPPPPEALLSSSLPASSGEPCVEGLKGKDSVKDAVRRLELQARQPQAVFLEALRGFREADAERWNQSFPFGFRARVAPEFLADVYSSGRKGKDWAREWLRERQLLDCLPARELMAVMTALDTLLFEDATADFINQIGTERLAKKGLGLFKAYEPVKKESDWRRPSGGGAKNWKSRVDLEAQRRIDPAVADAEGSFRYRAVEDEQRAEMEREANLLKARIKLEERRRSEGAAQGAADS